MADERGKAIELAVSQIEKQFGKGSIMRLGSKEAIVPIFRDSDGLYFIRRGSGCGRLFRAARGGSVWAGIVRQDHYHAAGDCRGAEDRRHGGVLWMPRHALDPAYAKKLGVDVDNLLVFATGLRRTGALRSRKRWCVRMPSMCCGGFGRGAGAQGRTRWRNGRQPHGAAGAADVTGACAKLTGTVSKSRTCLIFINQIREKIGVMFGNPEKTTTGGRALKFYSSVARGYSPQSQRSKMVT